MQLNPKMGPVSAAVDRNGPDQRAALDPPEGRRGSGRGRSCGQAGTDTKQINLSLRSLFSNNNVALGDCRPRQEAASKPRGDPRHRHGVQVALGRRRLQDVAGHGQFLLQAPRQESHRTPKKRYQVSVCSCMAFIVWFLNFTFTFAKAQATL